MVGGVLSAVVGKGSGSLGNMVGPRGVLVRGAVDGFVSRRAGTAWLCEPPRNRARIAIILVEVPLFTIFSPADHGNEPAIPGRRTEKVGYLAPTG
jgi:hypothetical protein